MAQYATLKAAIDAVIKANGQKEITGTVLNEVLTSMVNSLGANYQFAGMATPSTNPGTPDQNVFYIAGQGGTYTNFNNIAIPNGISFLIWNGSWSSQTVLSGDGGVFDISAYKATGGTLATFVDLSAALGTNGANIPEAIRKDGMSVKFIRGSAQSSDNNYIQARCMAQSFTTDVTQWQGVDVEPTDFSKNLIESGGVYKNITPILDLHCTAIGENTTLVRKVIELTKGHLYRFYLPEIDIEGLSLTDENVVFDIGTTDNETVYTLKKKDIDNNNVPVYVDRVIPDNGYKAALRFRSVAGHVLNVYYFDLEYSLKATNLDLQNFREASCEYAAFTNGNKPTFEIPNIAYTSINFNNLKITFPNETLKLFTKDEVIDVPVDNTMQYTLVNSGALVYDNGQFSVVGNNEHTKTEIVLLSCNNYKVSGVLAPYVYSYVDSYIQSKIKTETQRATGTEFNLAKSIGASTTALTVLSSEENALRPDGTTSPGGAPKTNKYDVSGLPFVFISGRQGNPTEYYALACAYDNSDNLLQSYIYTAGTNYDDLCIILPSGCKYLKVCSSNTGIQANVLCKTIGNVRDIATDVVSQIVPSIPNYWETYMQSKIATINTKAHTIGFNGDNFVFITDVHMNTNYGVSSRLIEYIIKNTSVRNVVFGGDTLSYASNKDKALEFLQNYRNSFAYPINLFAIRGNHDTEQSMTKGDFYSVFDRPLENTPTVLDKEVYYYRDNQAQKIRYIFCDDSSIGSTIDSTQQSWITQRITELASGWSVVLFAHSYWNATTIGTTPSVSTAGASLKNIIDAAVDNSNATIIALITGHTHADRDTVSSKGYAIISTTTDTGGDLASNYDPVTPTRTQGTTSEQAFDVFNIDTSAKKIYITRIGGNGQDREISYGVE